jgi:hypothetical protein
MGEWETVVVSTRGDKNAGDLRNDNIMTGMVED